MHFGKKIDLILLGVFFIFSCWFMWKSFSVNPQTHEFLIARNVVGDFGLHLSIVRSISRGNNIPVESPFFPGVLMPYHYGFDVLIGLLERAGIRIDIALNGISALALTALLYVIYLLPQRLFEKHRMVGIIAVFLFIFHSSLTFVDYVQGKSFSVASVLDIWRIPNYIHAGPFDGSLISIFFTPNVYANQRHTVMALAVGLWIIYWLWPALTSKKQVSFVATIFLGVLVGLLGWIHTLLFFGFTLVLGFLCFVYRKWGVVWVFLIGAAICFPRAWIVFSSGLLSHEVWNPGFLASKPFEWFSWVHYWWVNLGIAIFLMPASLLLLRVRQRLLFYASFILFIIANILQFSYRIDHNHTLINLFIVIGNFYIAYGLYWLWKRGVVLRVCAFLLFLILTLSGLLDLMALKNDYQLHVADAPKNLFMQWIQTTPKKSVFVSKQEILDPITLSGRYNYLGHDYYLSVMGYNEGVRQKNMKRYFEATDSATIAHAITQGIAYIVLPKGKPQDFSFTIDWNFWKTLGKPVYEDDSVTVYKL